MPKIVRIIKSLIARKVFSECSGIKEQFWSGEFWSKDYFTNTVGHHGTEQMISNYVKNQGVEKEYIKLKVNHQLELL